MIQELLISLPAILLAITIHEFSHGLAAHLLGDPTPKNQGRLTLNPLPHLDPLGALMLVVAHFGWAKPVQVNPYNFRGDRQRGMLLVALAGPASNILVALLGGILYNLVYGISVYFSSFAFSLILINVYLALFNLIPIPPLDGSKILASILPRRMHGFLYQLEAYGTIILVLLIVTNITSKVLGPIAMSMILSIIKFGYFVVGF